MKQSERISIDNACCFRPLTDGATRVIFEITRHCNLRCQHCMVPMGKEPRTVISHERILSFIKELSANNISKIMFTGGEPLLIEHIADYIQLAASQSILVDLNSNLTLLSQNILEKLKCSGIREITTSIDGDEKTHCAIRGDNDCFKKTINAVKMAVQNGIEVDIVCTVMKLNLDNIDAVFNIAQDLGAASLTFSGLILEGRASNMDDGYNIDALKDKIVKLRQNSFIPIRTVRLLNDDYSVCHKGKDMIGIDYLGNVHPCLQDKMLNPYNIMDYSLHDCIEHIRNSSKIGGCACFISSSQKC